MKLKFTTKSEWKSIQLQNLLIFFYFFFFFVQFGALMKGYNLFVFN